VLGIRLQEGDLNWGDSRPRSIILAILGLFRERGLLNIPLNNWEWRSDYKRTGIYGENWLFIYEAVRRKWTRDRSFTKPLQDDPLLSNMLAANVSFLNDSFFGAAKATRRRKRSVGRVLKEQAPCAFHG
jgi:hypothetical protein